MFRYNKRILSSLVCLLGISSAFFVCLKLNNTSDIYAVQPCPFAMNTYSWYEESTETRSVKYDVVETVQNNSNKKSNTTITRTRTKFTTLTAGLAADVNLMGSSLGYYAEVSAGNKDTVSISLNIELDPYESATVKFGSRTMRTTGKVYTYDHNCNLTSRNAGAYYSYSGYSVVE